MSPFVDEEYNEAVETVGKSIADLTWQCLEKRVDDKLNEFSTLLADIRKALIEAGLSLPLPSVTVTPPTPSHSQASVRETVPPSRVSDINKIPEASASSVHHSFDGTPPHLPPAVAIASNVRQSQPVPAPAPVPPHLSPPVPVAVNISQPQPAPVPVHVSQPQPGPVPVPVHVPITPNGDGPHAFGFSLPTNISPAAAIVASHIGTVPVPTTPTLRAKGLPIQPGNPAMVAPEPLYTRSQTAFDTQSTPNSSLSSVTIRSNLESDSPPAGLTNTSHVQATGSGSVPTPLADQAVIAPATHHPNAAPVMNPLPHVQPQFPSPVTDIPHPGATVDNLVPGAAPPSGAVSRIYPVVASTPACGVNVSSFAGAVAAPNVPRRGRSASVSSSLTAGPDCPHSASRLAPPPSRRRSPRTLSASPSPNPGQSTLSSVPENDGMDTSE